MPCDLDFETFMWLHIAVEYKMVLRLRWFLLLRPFNAIATVACSSISISIKPWGIVISINHPIFDTNRTTKKLTFHFKSQVDENPSLYLYILVDFATSGYDWSLLFYRPERTFLNEILTHPFNPHKKNYLTLISKSVWDNNQHLLTSKISNLNLLLSLGGIHPPRQSLLFRI